MSSSGTSLFAISLFGRAWRSLACTLCGWIVMLIYLLLQYAGHASDNPRWFAMPMTIGTYSLPYICGVWLIVVLPLFCLLRHGSRFWVWYVAPSLFALIGFVVMSAFFRFDYNPTTMRVARLAALVGASTGVVCAIWQRHLGSRLSIPSPTP